MTRHGGRPRFAVQASRGVLLAMLTLAGCRVLPPPPVLPPHAPTEPDDKGATTAMLVVGTAGQYLFGGDGWGVALRIEHQQTRQTTLGLELTGGRGDEVYYADRSISRLWLVGMRSYARFAPTLDGPLALMSGVGLSLTTTGLITGTLNAGVAIAYDNDNAIPVGTLGAALAVPLRAGRAFTGGTTQLAFGPPEPGAQPTRARDEVRVPVTEIYLGLGLGLLVPVGGTGNRLSGDISIAKAMRDGSAILSFTVGDAQRFDP